MGTWGTGLYSSDFALDMRAAVGAVARLPVDGDRLLEILSRVESSATNNPKDEGHTTFWLVVADQFARRAIPCDRVRDEALRIIDTGGDLAMRADSGMSPSDLRKRGKVLQDLRVRITAPPAGSGKRRTLRKPQAFLMNVGDVLVYPTCGGRCINPYFASKEQDRATTAAGWKQDGWSAFLVVDRGRAFDFLSWYRPLTVSTASVGKPTLAELQGDVRWVLQRPGTCSRVHYKRMELEALGVLPIDADRLRNCFPHMPPGTFEAIVDVSLANALNVGPSVPAISYEPPPMIQGIGQVLSS